MIHVATGNNPFPRRRLAGRLRGVSGKQPSIFKQVATRQRQNEVDCFADEKATATQCVMAPSECDSRADSEKMAAYYVAPDSFS